MPITLSAANLHTKECIYVKTTTITVNDNCAKLIFNPIEIPLDDQKRTQWESARQTASTQYANRETMIMVSRWLEKDLEFERTEKRAFAEATKIHIELHTPCTHPMTNNALIGPEHRIWTALVPVISEICRSLFPQLNPKKSSFILYFADQHEYSCKKNLKMNDNNLYAKLIWKP